MTRSRHQKISLTALFILTLLCLPFTSNASSEQSASGFDEYEALGASLCNKYNTENGIIVQMKETIKTTMERVEGKSNPTDKEIITFLNTHKNKLICWGKHYLMQAFDERVHMTVYKKLFKKDLYKKGEYQIDYNAITLTYNPQTDQEEFMTILDYIEKVALKFDHIKDSPSDLRNVAQIRRLIMRKFGALNYIDLPEADKEAFHSWYATQKK